MVLMLPVSGMSDVSIHPITQKVSLDKQIVAYIYVTPGASIAGMQSDIIYDPTIIRIDSIEKGSLFGTNTYYYAGALSSGKISNIFDVMFGPNSVNLPGDFVKITATPLKKGTSALTLNHVIVATPAGLAEPLSVTSGNVVVTTVSYDVNEDGVVDILDLQLVASHMGETTTGRWDTDDSTVIDIFDLLSVSKKI